MTLRPSRHLKAMAGRYPGAWKQYDSFRDQRASLGDWPAWCFAPVAAAYAIVSGGGDNEVPLDRMLDVPTLAALSAWRPCQGIYAFHSALFAELWEPVDRALPVDVLLAVRGIITRRTWSSGTWTSTHSSPLAFLAEGEVTLPYLTPVIV